MDFLTKLALKRPVSTLLALLALIVFGFSSILTFEMELLPEISAPVITVTTVYEGADAETVDKLVTTPVEELGTKMKGVYDVSSQTSTGSSVVRLQFDYGSDMDQVFMDLKTEIERISLPDGCNQPVILRMKTTSPFISMQVSSQSDGDVLMYVNNTVKPRLERLLGVAEVQISGGQEEYIRVMLDERLMDQYSVTLDSIRSALGSTEYNIPASTMRQGSMDIRLSSTSSLTSLSELEVLPVQTGTGNMVSLRDVADISYAARKADSISRHNGRENIRIDVTKNQSASTVTAARNVVAELARLEAEDSNIKFDVTMNSADEILKTLKEAAMTLIIGVLLSMLTLYLFFGDIKASLIVGSSMPISLLATLIIMAFTKIQMDMFAVAGLIISIGMMVDSSIVVLESCFRAQESGLDFRESAIKGTGDVTASIVASTITTVVVYAPIALVGGYLSDAFKGLCFTIIYAMLTSLLVALTFIPLFFMFYKPTEKKNAPAVLIMQKISARYSKAVRKTLQRRLAVVLVTIGMVIATVLMILSMNMELETTTDNGEFDVTVVSRKGTAMEVADENARKYEEILLSDPDVKDVDYTVRDNEASIYVYLKDKDKTPTSGKVDEYNALWADEKGVDLTVQASSSSISGSSSIAKVTLAGEDYDALKEGIYEAIPSLSEIEGVFKVSSQLEEGAPEAKIHIDAKKAMDAGLSPKNVAMLIANVNGGIQALKIKSEGEEYKVRLEYPEGQYDDLYKLMNLKLTGQNGRTVTLGDIAELKYEEAPSQIIKRNGLYSLDISLMTTEDEKVRVQNEADEFIKNMDLGSGAQVGTNASTEFMYSELKKMVMAIVASVFLVFLVMAMQFESPRFSLMVMMSIPFSLIGSIGLTFLTSGSLSGEGFLGVLMLVGMVVNDGILFVDTANGLKQDYPIKEALARSGELRLRPILMTTLTTVLSMVPLFFVDSSESIMGGMGLIIIGGMMASTTLILFLLPTFYTLFMGKKAKLEDLRRFPPEGWSEGDKPSSKKERKKKKNKNKVEVTEEIKEENKEENTEDDKDAGTKDDKGPEGAEIKEEVEEGTGKDTAVETKEEIKENKDIKAEEKEKDNKESRNDKRKGRNKRRKRNSQKGELVIEDISDDE